MRHRSPSLLDPEGFQYNQTPHPIDSVCWSVWWVGLKTSVESSRELKLTSGSKRLQRIMGTTNISSVQLLILTQTIWWSDQPYWLYQRPRLHSVNDIIPMSQLNDLLFLFFTFILPFFSPLRSRVSTTLEPLEDQVLQFQGLSSLQIWHIKKAVAFFS